MRYRYAKPPEAEGLPMIERLNNDGSTTGTHIPADPLNNDYRALLDGKVTIEPFVAAPGSRFDPNRSAVMTPAETLKARTGLDAAELNALLAAQSAVAKARS